MQISFDSNEPAPQLRALAAMLLTLAGDITLKNFGVEDSDVKITPPKPLADIPPPPPPPPELPASAPAESAKPAAASAVPTIPASATIALPAASATEPAEYDSAGLPWDARIHQKKKSKKQDGTWKLQKGIDTNLVQAVTTELAGRRQSNIPAPPPPAAVTAAVPLPPSGTVSVFPQSNATRTEGMPASASTPAVPVPPSPATGNIPTADPALFAALVAKIGEANKAGKIDPLKVSAIVQKCGAPNLSALMGMPHLIPHVDAALDLAIAGV